MKFRIWIFSFIIIFIWGFFNFFILGVLELGWMKSRIWEFFYPKRTSWFGLGVLKLGWVKLRGLTHTSSKKNPICACVWKKSSLVFIKFIDLSFFKNKNDSFIFYFFWILGCNLVDNTCFIPSPKKQKTKKRRKWKEKVSFPGCSWTRFFVGKVRDPKIQRKKVAMLYMFIISKKLGWKLT